MSALLGHDLAAKGEIQDLIDKLGNIVEQKGKDLPKFREPQPGHSDNSEKLEKEIDQTRGRPLFYPYIGTGIGRGPYVELEDGSVKIDLINGIGIHILGHSHPVPTKAALKASLSDIIMQGNLQPNKEYLNISKKLVDLAGRNSRLKHVWLSTCGTMANENALKMSRQKNSPARKILAMKSAFAGRSTLMAEVTDNPAFKQGLPDYNEVLRVSFYDKNDPKSTEKSLEEMRKHIDENKGQISCFCFEPMQGEGGYNVAPKEFFVPLLELCKENGIAVWADEVQTFCRTGEFFAFETLGIGEYIDICTIAKTAQNGATLYTSEYNPKPGLIAGTFSGSTVSLNSGYEILDYLDKNQYMGANGRITQVHNKFIAMLNKLNESSCKGLLQDSGGLGLMVATTPLDGSREKMLALLKTLYKNGLMTFGCGRGPFRLRFLLPAIMQDEDIAHAGKIIEKSVLELA